MYENYRHGQQKQFSCKGIDIAVKEFKDRGHSDITAVIPNWRLQPANDMIDHILLGQLKDNGHLITSPSKSYDDR